MGHSTWLDLCLRPTTLTGRRLCLSTRLSPKDSTRRSFWWGNSVHTQLTILSKIFSSMDWRVWMMFSCVGETRATYRSLSRQINISWTLDPSKVQFLADFRYLKIARDDIPALRQYPSQWGSTDDRIIADCKFISVTVWSERTRRIFERSIWSSAPTFF